MAERRMLSKNLILFDGLADLPHTTQLLYIYLNIQADDDGFVGNPRPVCGMLGCDSSHLDTLLGNGYLLQFEGGMVVIRHWHVHNQIRKDRYKPTRFLEERARLTIDDTGCYQMAENAGFSLVDNLATQERTGQDRVEKDRIEEDRKAQKRKGKTRTDQLPARKMRRRVSRLRVSRLWEIFRIKCMNCIRSFVPVWSHAGTCPMPYAGRSGG